MLLAAERSQLVLVDYQERLLPHIADTQQVVANARLLGRMARALGIPTWGTEQSPEKLGPNDDTIRALCARTLGKTHFDACADGLEAWLQEAPRHSIVVAGCEAHVCLMQTALGMRERGWEVWVVSDACGSRTPANRAAALHRLEREGAKLITTEMVGFEWIRRADHPQFKTLQSLFK